jgi:hypothetical protein
MTTIAEAIIHSAEIRLDLAIREWKRQVYGDEEYHAEVEQVAKQDLGATFDPPPPATVRKRLIPNWAWWKRHGR